MRDDRERLKDMLEAVNAIERYRDKGRVAFDQEELIQTWMIHHIQVIGEAASRMSPEFVKAHEQIPWAKIVAMRNLLIHTYVGVDLDEVWTVISKDLPELKRQIEFIM